MTNYLEEKTDKDCTFEGLQGSRLLVKMSTFNSIYRQSFLKWTREFVSRQQFQLKKM